MLLESTQHARSWFVTLTYAPENVPAGGTLKPRDLKLFLMRLRFAAQEPFRYFAVGEYGDRTFRPHYHVTLFGLDRFDTPSLVEKAWGLGFTKTGLASPEGFAYVAGYTLKKMTKAEDARLEGRYPEFARMSLRPGLGAGAAVSIAEFYTTLVGVEEFLKKGDVCGEIRIGGQVYPLGRYLKSHVRDAAGLPKSLSVRELGNAAYPLALARQRSRGEMSKEEVELRKEKARSRSSSIGQGARTRRTL